LNNLAHILLVQSKIVTAKPYVKRLETEHGSFAEGLDTVALFYWKKNDLEKSISVSEKALRLQPNNVLIIKNYIERLADFGNLEQAKRLLRRNESKLNYNDVRDLKSKLDAIG
jgi:tetratricopeptide (TPR) repeat protein